MSGVVDRLEKLKDVVARHKRLPGEIEQERRDAAALVEARRADLRRYYEEAQSGSPDPAREKKLRAAVASAEAAADMPWGERLEAAKKLRLDAERDLAEFVGGEREGLAAALAAISVSRRDAFEAALEELRQTWAALQDTSHWAPLTREVDLGPIDSSFALQQAMRELDRAVEAGVPVPVPRELRRAVPERAAA